MAFAKETVRFLAGLQRNNKKEWFESHRTDYDQHFEHHVAMAPIHAWLRDL